MKGPSEAAVREALRDCGLALHVYKPPDDARNWKPADYLVWVGDRGVWIEVKATDQAKVFPLKEIRPSQRTHSAVAGRLGIPYLLVVYWSRTRDWTISDAVQVLEWEKAQAKKPTSIPRTLLQTRFGVQAEGRLLPGTLKLAMLGEL